MDHTWKKIEHKAIERAKAEVIEKLKQRAIDRANAEKEADEEAKRQMDRVGFSMERFRENQQAIKADWGYINKETP